MRKLILLLILVFAPSAFGSEVWKVNTLVFEGEPATQKGKVKVQWEGEFINDTAVEVTIHGVLELNDGKGTILKALETSAVNVGRFSKQGLKEKYLISEDVWEKTLGLSQWGEKSDKDPVNGQRMRQIELYGTSWCKWCSKARVYLSGERIDYVDYDVERDKEAAAKLQEVSGAMRFPTLVIDGKVAAIGWSEASFKAAIFPEAKTDKGKEKVAREQPER